MHESRGITCNVISVLRPSATVSQSHLHRARRDHKWPRVQGVGAVFRALTERSLTWSIMSWMRASSAESR